MVATCQEIYVWDSIPSMNRSTEAFGTVKSPKCSFSRKTTNFNILYQASTNLQYCQLEQCKVHFSHKYQTE